MSPRHLASSPSILSAALLLLAACDGGNPEVTDAATECAAHRDCDDGLYCNGAEACDPSDPNANGFGCVARPSPCPAGSCVESESRCAEPGCADADADGDGAMDVACGGDDCDVSDRDRYPSRTERCDFLDDDCDPSTLGERDADGDGFTASFCCNGDRCGSDCDDTRAGVSPTSPEVCNRIDDDCDGSVDEGVVIEAWPDGDRDGYGDEGSSVELRCDLPSDRASRGGDCDDLDASRNPQQVDRCDGIDQDCDGSIDEGADALCDDDLGNSTLGACVTPPDGSIPRCWGLRCGPSADSCGGVANRCDRNLCTSQVACGACGEGCLDCNEGRCGVGGVGLVTAELRAVDAATGAPLVAEVAPVGSCDADPYGTADPTGAFSLFLSYPEDAAFDQVRLSAPGRMDTLVDPLPAFGSPREVPLYEPAFYASLLADPAVDLTADPELGVLVIDGGLPFTDAIADPGFILRADGTVVPLSDGSPGLRIYPNVLPGDYRVHPLPDQCSSTESSCQRQESVGVEGGAVTIVSFRCVAFGCSA